MRWTLQKQEKEQSGSLDKVYVVAHGLPDLRLLVMGSLAIQGSDN